MELTVGAVVVYAAHGVGRIVGHENRVVGGIKQSVVVVAFQERLTISLPVGLAQSQLRALASEAELQIVQQTLRKGAVATGKPWLARRRDLQEKLADGSPLALAEIIRDTAPRTVTAAGVRTKGSSGHGEQDVFRKARLLLSTEIAEVRGVEVAEADSWVESQLTNA
jgi:RNA polymerase-interacting CarD/CdnL/TRCF family regulator